MQVGPPDKCTTAAPRRGLRRGCMHVRRVPDDEGDKRGRRRHACLPWIYDALDNRILRSVISVLDRVTRSLVVAKMKTRPINQAQRASASERSENPCP